MSLSQASIFLRVLLTSTLYGLTTAPDTTSTTTTLPPYCPTKCVCMTTLRCNDLGEQSRVLNLTAVVPSNFSNVTFVGRTKIRTIQTRAFSGLRVQRLRLDRLGVRDIESGAFLGVSDLLEIDVGYNHISGVVNSRTFAVNSALKTLNIRHNDIESVSSNAFSSVGGSSLINLSLANNRLSVLPDPVFATLTGLENLFLSGNRLTNLTQPLFDNLSNLVRLLLANNRISHLDSTLFNSLSSLEQLSLENNELSFLPSSVFNRLISLRTLTLQGNRLSAVHLDVFFVQPTDQQSSYPRVISTLNLDRNRFDDLAQVQISVLSTLETLTLAANRLTAIPDGYFAGFNSINVLDLSRNNISSVLKASSFARLISLTSLNLSSNNIRSVLPGTFGASLYTLDLSDNELTVIKPGTFENAQNLTNLYLRNCGLKSVNRGVFNITISLENLDLSDNVISNVQPDSFVDLPSLRQVDMSKNNMNFVSSGVFINTSLLSSVAFDENRLTNISVDIMSNLLNLRNFTLAHNNIGSLLALQSQSVDILNLTGNSISYIVDGAFNGTPQIRELYLDQNKLTRIRLLMFSGLKFLSRLDLSDNLISTIDNRSFQHLTYLTYLSLRGNQLTSIEPDTFSGLSSINILDLSANRLVSQITQGLRLSPLQYLILDDNDIVSFDVNYLVDSESALQRLSLRRNRISELQFDHGLSFFLNFLDLGENQITSEIFGSLQHLTLLKTLKLDGNDIDSVPIVGVLNESLTELDLSNNALTDSSLATIVQLRRLQQLRLDGNFISNLSAADWSMLGDSLSVLSLSNNRLTSLNQIDKLWSLTQLNVDNNLIDSIPDATFQTLYDLDVVSLRGNRLTTIGQYTLDGLEQKCTHLDLSSNFIEYVHPKAFYRLKNIKRLNLSNNSIKELVMPPIMDRLSELLLSNNRLARFPDGLRRFGAITVLSLYNNMIESMPPLDIGNEFGVTLIDLSSNRLRNIDQVRFVGLLNSINISGNQLADIGADVLADTSFIGELNLSDNPLGRLTVAVTRVVDHIARLYADRCSLTSLDNWVFVGSQTTRLVELSLSGNRLDELPSIVVSLVNDSLQHLDVRGNLLSTLGSEESYGRSLRRLSLAGNPWLCDCQLAWLRRRIFTIDNATCWTPATTIGQHVVCYNVDDCSVPAANQTAYYYDICKTTATSGLHILM